MAKILSRLLSVLVLLAPALYNGFPLVYSDTGTYILSGMELSVPLDRPIFYGLFIRLSSLGLSLWLVVGFQALIASFALWKLWKFLLPGANYSTFLIVLVPLSYLTSLGWYTSQLMPDIFTVLGVLSGMLLLLDSSLVMRDKIALSSVLVLSLLVHNSNLLIVFGSLFLLWLWLKRQKQATRTLLASSLFIGSLVIAMLVNYGLSGSAKLSRGGHVFLMGKMLDSGVLETYLNDKCGKEDLALCAFRDSLPMTNRELLWDPKSPVNALGGWETCEKEFNNTLTGIFTSPKHLLLYFRSCITSTGAQLFQNDLGSGLISTWYRSPNSPPASQINLHFGTEYNDYQLSRQNGNLWGQELEINWIRITNKILLLLSSILLLSLLLLPAVRSQLENHVRMVVYTCLTMLVVNALVVASLANVYDRLQARVSWVLIFISLALFLRYGSTLLNNIRELWQQNQLHGGKSS